MTTETIREYRVRLVYSERAGYRIEAEDQSFEWPTTACQLGYGHEQRDVKKDANGIEMLKTLLFEDTCDKVLKIERANQAFRNGGE
jgi:hypothetical protein